jgi:hypothetical protein
VAAFALSGGRDIKGQTFAAVRQSPGRRRRKGRIEARKLSYFLSQAIRGGLTNTARTCGLLSTPDQLESKQLDTATRNPSRPRRRQLRKHVSCGGPRGPITAGRGVGVQDGGRSRRFIYATRLVRWSRPSVPRARYRENGQLARTSRSQGGDARVVLRRGTCRLRLLPVIVPTKLFRLPGTA